MVDIKLPQLPDRTPVKLTINASPDLNRTLARYAELYNARYGQKASVTDLIPAMLDHFLASDREFVKINKSVAGKS